MMKDKDTEKSFEERWIEDDSYALGKKAGIKEVVDWVHEHQVAGLSFGIGIGREICVPYAAWLDYLKRLGLL